MTEEEMIKLIKQITDSNSRISKKASASHITAYECICTTRKTCLNNARKFNLSISTLNSNHNYYS